MSHSSRQRSPLFQSSVTRSSSILTQGIAATKINIMANNELNIAENWRRQFWKKKNQI